MITWPAPKTDLFEDRLSITVIYIIAYSNHKLNFMIEGNGISNFCWRQRGKNV
jgi:hypothetical protein